MAKFINDETIKTLVEEVLAKDMNEVLEQVTDKVLAEVRTKVKEKVAARMIAVAGSEYNLYYQQHELVVKVKID